jgi:DNA repair exonuclease SbcCD ATPase subunit
MNEFLGQIDWSLPGPWIVSIVGGISLLTVAGFGTVRVVKAIRANAKLQADMAAIQQAFAKGAQLTEAEIVAIWNRLHPKQGPSPMPDPAPAPPAPAPPANISQAMVALAAYQQSLDALAAATTAFQNAQLGELQAVEGLTTAQAKIQQAKQATVQAEANRAAKSAAALAKWQELRTVSLAMALGT